MDPGVEGAIPVALLSEPSFDARAVDFRSLTFAGSGVTKTAIGATHRLEDVNHDGRQDLVVLFSQRDLQLGRGATRATLAGRTEAGERIVGHATLHPMSELREAARQRAFPPTRRKSAPLAVPIDVFPGDPANAIDRRIPPAVPVAILSRSDFDAASIVPGTIQLGGAPITRNAGGRLSESRDVNGDGLPDLLVQVQGAPLRLSPGTNRLTLSGQTAFGTLVSGEDQVRFSPLSKITFHNPGGAKPKPVQLEFASTSLITINDSAPATPYPSNILVSGASGVISEINVTITGLTHTYPADLDILLVGPSGQSLILMSDAAGGGTGLSGVTLSFDDDADTPLPLITNPPSGRYRPTDLTNGPTADAWPAPAPPPAGSAGLSAFNDTDANGVWSLYVVDDEGSDIGSIVGWSITLVMAAKFSSNDFISIPTIGVAAPFPSMLNVSGLAGQVVSKATVTLHAFAHTYPDDIVVLLVGPGGQTAVLMGAVGGLGPGVTSVDLTFDDHVLAALTSDLNPRSGTYRPSQLTPDLFPLSPPAPAGPYGMGLSNFLGTPADGAWSLYVEDFADGDSGSIDGWDLTLTVMPPEPRHNFLPITIPAGAPAVTQGNASPYPSTINVTDVPGRIGKVTITLHGLTHTYPDDLDIYLDVGGNCMPLISDAGGSFGVDHIDVTFDEAGAPLPDNGPLATGAYLPGDFNAGDIDPVYLHCTGYTFDLGTLHGGGTLGPWSLYVDDDEPGDSGSLAAGWSITFENYITAGWFCNEDGFTDIMVPGGQPGNTSGPADYYPSITAVSGIDRPVGRVRFGIEGFHESPEDLDLLLVGPDGTTGVVVMSDVGGSTLADPLLLDIEDSATEPIPFTTPGFDGRYRPTNHNDGLPDVFPAPAPAPSATSLSGFTQIDPNGPWSLFAMDDKTVHTGFFHWCLQFTLLTGVPEVKNLRWSGTTGTQLGWEPEPEALAYSLYRGGRADLPNLLNTNPDSCLRTTISATTATGLTENPPVGSFFWYLVRGSNNEGLGTAGFALQGSLSLAREQNEMGACPP